MKILKHVLFVVLGALAVLAVGMSYAPASDAKVFGHYTAVDNHDGCLTPQENLENLQSDAELINIIDNKDAILSFKKAVEKKYQVAAASQDYDYVQVFQENTAPKDLKRIFVFRTTTPGVECAIADIQELNYEELIKDAGLENHATNLHPGFIGKSNQ